MTNQDRINKIIGVVDDYYDSDSSGVTDLLADVMHYCKETDMNFQVCLLAARMHFDAEQKKEW